MLLILIIACAVTVGVNGKTCTVCKSDFDAAKTSAGADDVKKCTAVKTYVGCVEDATGDGCPIAAADVKTLYEDITDATTKCVLSDGCKCQYDFYIADLTTDAKHCTALKKRVSCLKLKTGVGCADTKTVIVLATDTKSKADGVTGCTIDKSCGCEWDYAKADISDDGKKCTAAKTFINCLRGNTAVGCAGGKVTDLATAAGTTITGLTTNCDISKTVCQCDLEFAKTAHTSDAEKCTAGKKELSCLIGKTGNGCDGTKTLINRATDAETAVNAKKTCEKTDVCECEITYAKATLTSVDDKCKAAKKISACMAKSVKSGCGSDKKNIGGVIDKAITDLTTAKCSLTSVCKCEVAFNKMDVTDAKKCDSSKTYTKCLDAITKKTAMGCDGTSTTTMLKADHQKLDLCSKSGMQPLMASLAVVFISAFISMF